MPVQLLVKLMACILQVCQKRRAIFKKWQKLSYVWFDLRGNPEDANGTTSLSTPGALNLLKTKKLIM